MTQLTKLFEPGKIGKLELKNRLLCAPMGALCDLNGIFTPHGIRQAGEKAKGGASLVNCGSSCVLYDGRAPFRAANWDDSYIPMLREVGDIIHQHGAKAALQVVHHGKVLSQWSKYYEHPEEIDVVGPSAIPWVWNNVAPREATKEDIERLVEAFGEGARRIKEAGFDLVEILGGHGYGICQWLSPLTNHRTDEYGGSVEDRARFACEIISSVRERVGPDLPISFRVSGSEFIEGGLTIDDIVRMAPLFVKAGANALHITAGAIESTNWTNPSYLFADAPLVPLAEAVKKAVDVPVIAVGKIGDPFLAEKILEEGKADFIAMGRALMADPQLPNKAREGRFDEIRRCIYCNNCWDVLWRQRILKHGITFSCTVNPALFREEEFKIEPTASPKRVMVIGGGLAGMEAAITLAERGHQVSLYEKSDKLGGQWNIAAMAEGKDIYNTVTQRMLRDLDRTGVEVILNREVTAELVRELKPDVAIVATGATPRVLDVPGADGPNVVLAVDVVAGKAKVSDTVVVVGGRYLGMETALLLAKQGKRVSLVTERELGRNGRWVERNVKITLKDRLIEHGVYIHPFSPVREIRDNGVMVAQVRELTFLKADTVVLAVGMIPENKLIEELKDIVEVHAIGDCIEPRDAMEAIGEGAELGRQI